MDVNTNSSRKEGEEGGELMTLVKPLDTNAQTSSEEEEMITQLTVVHKRNVFPHK